MAHEVRHEPAYHRFAIGEGEQTAVLMYRQEPGRITFVHTEVPSALEGHGVGSELAHAGLEYARSQHLQVIARCPFVAKYLEHHPEYADSVSSGDR
jgi:hypothetical protein